MQLEHQKEKRENEAEEIFEELMVENFPKFMTDIKPQIQKLRNIKQKTKTSHLGISFSNC